MNQRFIILSLALIIGLIMVTIPYVQNDIEAISNKEASVHSVDSDGDYLPDYKEIQMGLDPTNQDSDLDLISDLNELYLGTDPLNWDTDSDKMADGHEKGARHGSTSPFEDDTDHDGLPDPWEDNDDDGILNREEQLPMHDGVCFWIDIFRVEFGEDFGDRTPLDPNDPDTDGDGWDDGEEIQVNGTYTGQGAVPNPPPRDRVNPELDIANSNSYASWLVRNYFGWDSATFADWRDGLKKAGSYLSLIPSGCTNIAWYHFSPYWIFQHLFPNDRDNITRFNTWKNDYFHGSTINPNYGVSNEAFRGTWDSRLLPYEWNRYDCDPTLNDTDGDFMDDDWDSYPLRYNTRNGTYAAMTAIRRVGHSWIPAISPYEDIYYQNTTVTLKWNYFGTNISVLQLEKGDWVDINIAIGLEHCNITETNFLQSNWDPISVMIQFRRIDLGVDNLPHTSDDEVNDTNVAHVTRRFTLVRDANRITDMSEVTFINHLGQTTTLTFYYQIFRIRIPSRVPAGQIAIVLETECENNFHYFPSDEYSIY